MLFNWVSVPHSLANVEALLDTKTANNRPKPRNAIYMQPDHQNVDLIQEPMWSSRFCLR